MARKVRSSPLESRSARLKLAPRGKPYWTKLAEGLSLGYRRLATGSGSWSMRVADGRGGNWVKVIAPADDFEGTAGALDFWAAQRRAVELARGGAPDDTGKLQTVNEAVAAYAADLKARGGESANATRLTYNMTPALGTKIVATLTARELRAWRDGLLAKGLSKATVTRTAKCLAAALALAAASDPRIQNRDAWRHGLAALPDSNTSRNVILSDEQVRSIVAAAHTVGQGLGLLLEVAAVTGARPSQIKRLRVGDMLKQGLHMPGSRKGKGRKRIEHRPVPIGEALLLRLRQEAKGRPADAPLLTNDSGKAWGKGEHRDPVREAVARAGLDPDVVTLYALRHSAITRMLLKAIPVRIVADQCDTSVGQIEKTYSKFIAHHADEMVRAALIDLTAPPTTNVVSLPTGR